MAKIKTKHAADKGIQEGSTVKVATLSDLKQNAQVWYKIHVLPYDICNIATDRSSEMRTLSTTDELYISSSLLFILGIGNDQSHCYRIQRRLFQIPMIQQRSKAKPTRKVTQMP